MQRTRFGSKGYSVHDIDEDERAEIEREVEKTRQLEDAAEVIAQVFAEDLDNSENEQESREDKQDSDEETST